MSRVAEFLAAARALGLLIEGEPIANTARPVRVRVEGRNYARRDGWYSLHVPPAGPAWAAFGRWDDPGSQESWREGGPARRLTAAERDQAAEQRRAADRDQARTQQRVAERALELWESASAADDHPYLKRKAVAAFNVRQLGARLLIPLRKDGRLRSLQTIEPDGSKRFLTGGEVRGCFHWLGDPKGAAVALICEGYATAASLHAATGYPIAAAMNAGNVLEVARAVRRQLGADATLLICGDDDRGTKAKIGTNPGRDAAQRAARSIAARWCVPADLPDGATDFNDLHQARGLEVVRAQIEAALAGKRMKATADNPEREVRPTAGPRFTVDDRGVWFHGSDRDGNAEAEAWICSPLRVEAYTRDTDGAEWGFLISLPDPEGTTHRIAIPARMLAGDGAELRAWLLSLGLKLAPGSRARERLAMYLTMSRPKKFARCTDRTGWHGRAFVFVDRTLGSASEPVIFQSATAAPSAFRSHGSAADWRERVGVLCRGNSRLVFAVAAGLAAPLLHWARVDSFGFHLRSASSTGKTTAARVGASVFGPPEFVQTWRSTANAIEGTAAAHCDALTVLDDIAELDPREVIAAAYQLGNGAGKARLHRTGQPRERLRWRTVIISTGEISIEQHAASAGKRQTAGAEVRIIDLPAEPATGAGVFEELHGEGSGDAFARRLARECGEVYGSVGPAWIERVAADPETLGEAARRACAEFVQANARDAIGGQVARVAARFGLVGFAGEAATAAGLTGWAKGEAIAAARDCFRAWLDARGGAGNLEERQILGGVRAFLQAHGQSRMPWLHRATDDRAPDKPLRVGYRVLLKNGERVKGGDDFDRIERGFADSLEDQGSELHHWIFPETFRAEICAGFDHKFASRLLLDRHWLRGERDGDRMRPDRKERTPLDGSMRFFCFTPKALSEDY